MNVCAQGRHATSGQFKFLTKQTQFHIMLTIISVSCSDVLHSRSLLRVIAATEIQAWLCDGIATADSPLLKLTFVYRNLRKVLGLTGGKLHAAKWDPGPTRTVA